MTESDLLQFLRKYRYAVEASVSESGAPQAAVVGIAIADDLSLVCDTMDSTRKVQNLRRGNKVALVMGGDRQW